MNQAARDAVGRAYPCIGGPLHGEMRAWDTAVFYARERIEPEVFNSHCLDGTEVSMPVKDAYVRSVEYRLQDHPKHGIAWVCQ